MSPTHAPLQLYNVFKSCMIVFLLQAVVYILIAPIILDLTIRFLVLLLNLVVSVSLGWRLYTRRYHTVFTYDGNGFTLKKGIGKEISNNWSEYSKVSLVRSEEGDFSIRLYKGSAFFDLPASKLKLNPFDFRLEVMQLVSTEKSK